MNPEELMFEADKVVEEVKAQCLQFSRIASKMDDLASKIENTNEKSEMLRLETSHLSLVQLIDDSPKSLTTSQDKVINFSMGLNAALIMIIVFIFYCSQSQVGGRFE